MAGAAPSAAPLPQTGARAPTETARTASEAVLSIETLRKRDDFLKAARARRKAGPAFLLQARKRADAEADRTPPGRVRVGFTCSKKVGNAVARNRAKRRLREIARAVLGRQGLAGWDYVLVGFRNSTAQRDMSALIADLEACLEAVHMPRRPAPERERRT